MQDGDCVQSTLNAATGQLIMNQAVQTLCAADNKAFTVHGLSSRAKKSAKTLIADTKLAAYVNIACLWENSLQVGT